MIEHTVLGMILEDHLNLGKAKSIGINDSYFDGNLLTIWMAINSLDEKVNFSNVRSILPDDCYEDLCKCASSTPIALNFDYFSNELVVSKWCKTIGMSLSNLARSFFDRKEFDPIDPQLNQLTVIVEESKNISKIKRAKALSSLANDLEDELDKRITEFEKGKKLGISTGITLLDRLIIGFSPAKLYVLAARTSIGKTTIAVNFFLSALKQKRKTIFFSVEMTEIEILEKVLSLDAKVDDFSLTKGAVRNQIDKINESLLLFRNFPGYLTSSFDNSIENIETEIKSLYDQGGLDFAIVDYAQELTTKTRAQSRTYEIADICRRLKAVSLKFKIPILVLCQLNRESENRPRLSDLKDSDSLALAADGVMLLWKDENSHWLEVAKGRKGIKTGTMKLKADLNMNKFSDYLEGNGEVKFYK